MNILYVIHNIGQDVPESRSTVIAGGCENFTYQLAHRLSEDNTCYILYLDIVGKEKMFLHKIENFRNELVGTFEIHSKFQKANSFLQVLEKFKIDLIHYQHLINYPLGLVTIGRAKRIPQILNIHDYFYICEEYFLQSDKYMTCDIPTDIKKCGECLSNKLDVDPKHVVLRRSMMKDALSFFDRIYLSSKSVRSDYFKIFPECNDKFIVTPLGIKPIPLQSLPDTDTLNVGIPCYITFVKGMTRLFNVIRTCEKHLPKIKFHILCDQLDKPVAEYLSCFSNVDIDAENFSEVNLIWLPTIAKETFSLIVSENLFRGIPILAEDKGAFSERLKDVGFLYKRNSTSEDIVTHLKEIQDDMTVLSQAHEDIKNIRDDIPTLDYSVNFFKNQYEQLVK